MNSFSCQSHLRIYSWKREDKNKFFISGLHVDIYFLRTMMNFLSFVTTSKIKNKKLLFPVSIRTSFYLLLSTSKKYKKVLNSMLKSPSPFFFSCMGWHLNYYSVLTIFQINRGIFPPPPFLRHVPAGEMPRIILSLCLLRSVAEVSADLLYFHRNHKKFTLFARGPEKTVCNRVLMTIPSFDCWNFVHEDTHVIMKCFWL